MDYLVMRSPLHQILPPARCHLRQIPPLLSQKVLFRQIILAIHMNIQSQGSEFRQMAGLHQIQQMLLGRLTVKHKLIQG